MKVATIAEMVQVHTEHWPGPDAVYSGVCEGDVRALHQSPNSAGKIGADAMAMSFYPALGLPVIFARPFNTYGPRQTGECRRENLGASFSPFPFL